MPFIPRGSRNPPAGPSTSAGAPSQRPSVSEEERLREVEAQRRQAMREQAAAAALRRRFLAETAPGNEGEGSEDESVSACCLHPSSLHLHSLNTHTFRSRNRNRNQQAQPGGHHRQGLMTQMTPTCMIRPTTSMRDASETAAGASQRASRGICSPHPSPRRAASAPTPSAREDVRKATEGGRAKTRLRVLAARSTRTKNTLFTSPGDALRSH